MNGHFQKPVVRGFFHFSLYLFLVTSLSCSKKPQLDIVDTMMDVTTMGSQERVHLITTVVLCDDKDINVSVVGCIIRLKEHKRLFAQGRKIDKYIKQMINIREDELYELQKENLDEKKWEEYALKFFVLQRYLHEVLKSYSEVSPDDLPITDHRARVSQIVAEVDATLIYGGLVK